MAQTPSRMSQRKWIAYLFSGACETGLSACAERDLQWISNVRSRRARDERADARRHLGRFQSTPTDEQFLPDVDRQHLRAALGEFLFIIGTSAARSAGLPARIPIPNSLKDALSELHMPLFLLDLRGAARNPGAAAWLDPIRPLRANSSSELDINLHQAFDALVFINELTPARTK
jgi:hypothetical protein